MNEFSISTKVFFEEGAIRRLREFHGKSALVVHDPIMKELGACEQIRQLLTEAGAAAISFLEVRPEPDVELVANGICLFDGQDGDTLVAIGGGAAIDTAKAILYFCDKRERKPLFAAIPSTSGTGSEVTNFSVITASGKKNVLIRDDITPDIALLDTDYLKTLPRKVIADTGIDALVHGIEAYVARFATDYTDALAEAAVKLIFRWLKAFYDDPENGEARKHMINASCMAGMAFTNANLGITHSLAHALGARFHLSHGRANALLMLPVIAYNADLGGRAAAPAAEKYRKLAEALGFPARTAREGTVQLIQAIRQLQRDLDIPHSIGALGTISREMLEDAAEDMAEGAMKDRCTPGNPVQPRKEEMIQLFRLAFAGKLTD